MLTPFWLAAALAVGAPGQAVPGRQALLVGWHDEMNRPAAWTQAGGTQVDTSASRYGALVLRLPHVPDGYPYTYQWGTVTREVVVDLGRYPVLVARVSGFRPGTYAHLDIERKDNAGSPSHTLRTDALQEGGLIVYDLGSAYGPYIWRFSLRLAMGGALEGAGCEYDWVRFVRREDVPLLKAHPDWQIVTQGL